MENPEIDPHSYAQLIFDTGKQISSSLFLKWRSSQDLSLVKINFRLDKDS